MTILSETENQSNLTPLVETSLGNRAIYLHPVLRIYVHYLSLNIDPLAFQAG